jgi:hypothetical protein
MSNRKVSPGNGSATALRPAAYAGAAAALVSVLSAVVIRAAPTLETVVAVAHLGLTVLFYATAGALAARLGADGWRAGLFAGLVDGICGHTLALLIAAPPDPARIALPSGIAQTAENLARAQTWNAILGAIATVIVATGLGALGAFNVRRARGQSLGPRT